MSGWDAFWIVAGVVAVILAGSYLWLRLSAFCAGQEW